jgi:hypothetical protein
VTIGVHQVASRWLFDLAPPLDVVANVGQSPYVGQFGDSPYVGQFGTRRTLASSEPAVRRPVRDSPYVGQFGTRGTSASSGPPYVG